MARMVSLWRCTCGTRVKVVAETDSTPSAHVDAACPGCGETQAIRAARIITVTEDTSDRSSSFLIPCEEKARLSAEHKKAFDIYRRGALEVAKAVATMSHAEFEFLANKVNTARQCWLETRERLNVHTAKHGC